MKINSIFESISGESGPVIRQGEWTTFIRTQGCNLCCNYCDTGNAQDFKQGLEMTIGEILGRCYTKNVLITGGEPLAQSKTTDLIVALANAGHVIQIETNGTYPPPISHSNVGYAMDIKCPCSGEAFRMPSPNDLEKEYLQKGANLDLKFVVASMADVGFALPYVEKMRNQIGRAVFSPMYEGQNINKGIDPADIIEAVRRIHMSNKLVISLQLHKILNLA